MEVHTVTTGRAAEIVGVDRSTLLRWIRRGLFADVERNAANHRVWKESDIQRLLAFWREHEDRRMERLRNLRRKAG
jgi:DNA-binding transcriptional MerR regulator